MLTLSQFAAKVRRSRSRIHTLILQGRIHGAVLKQVPGGRKSGIWMIPLSARVSKIK